MNKMLIGAAAVILALAVGFFTGVHHDQFKQLKVQQKITVERDKLQTKINAKDVQIQQLQAAAAAKQDKIIYQKEVVYRDKIKNADVRQCVVNSGLLGLYDATVSATGK